MARLYKLQFNKIDEDYGVPKRKYVEKFMKVGANLREFLASDGTLTVLENDIKKYWDWGLGVASAVYVGEIDSSLFNPVLAEPDFVDEQIKSKKNGELLGYQG